MPIARIDFQGDRPAGFARKIGDLVYQAMVDVLGSPLDDKFQVITPHPAGELNYASSYLGIEYSDSLIIIQITLNSGRTTQQKKDFYTRVADDLHREADVRREDVIINLVETAPENWSFGNGLAPYA